MSYHLRAFELINQLFYVNFPSLERRFFQKDLKSMLPSSVALWFSNLGTIRNDHSTGYIGIAVLIKHGLLVNKEYRDNDFNIITNNQGLAIDLKLSNKQNVTLATIYCPNGNPNLALFQTINNLTDNVMFVGDFSSKLESFDCAKKNTSGPICSKISKKNLALFT